LNLDHLVVLDEAARERSRAVLTVADAQNFGLI
jgi:hypothetical protein